jgi:broad specificity phosphatase PhoE
LSTLYLIRHGQASFGAHNYDVLSELGARQGRALGAYFAARELSTDALYVGPRVRHEDTARHFTDAACAGGATVPASMSVADLDEYPALELLEYWTPRLMAEDPSFRAIVNQTTGADDNQRFVRVFAPIVARWVRGELSAAHIESFADFHARIRRGLSGIMAAEGRSKSVAVVTSGGPVCMALQWALGLADEMALRQSWVIGNCSVSEFRYRDDNALTLVGFNNLHHLGVDQITYR